MERIFTPEDQQKFAQLSGDYNPIHVDAIAARRFMFGRPVVHGIHLVIWAIDRLLSSDQRAQAIKKLNVTFRSPVIVGEPVELQIGPAKADRIRLDISSGSVKKTTINLTLADARKSVVVPDVLPPKQACLERAPNEVSNASGTLPLCFANSMAMDLFPFAGHLLASDQLAMLLATTRLVGMELPGLHSLYTGLELIDAGESGDSMLCYAAQSFDERFSLLTIGVKGGGLSGTISAAVRPAPQQQASFAALQTYVGSGEFAHLRALVIGGSRGLGEVVVKALAAGGADVRFTYHRGAADAQGVVDQIIAGGGAASCFAYDVTGDTEQLQPELENWSPNLLCYFATPFIFSANADRFSAELFRLFCNVYVLGFLKVFDAVAGGGIDVINPSSSALDELPSNMREYTAAKAAAEMLCQSLAKSWPHDVFLCPRLPRLPTDQTASLLSVDVGDPVTIIIKILRDLRKRRS